MTLIQNRLLSLQDKEYAIFQRKLIPHINPESVIGVRIPECRKIAKELYKTSPNEVAEFLSELPHRYYDENILHALFISEIKDYEQCLRALEDFLPFVDNWAVCDIISPKCFKKHKTELLPIIKKWAESSAEYTIRFGIEMLMSFYLDEDFYPEYLEIPAGVISEKYYVKMMVAWFFATALAKQWNSAIEYIENDRLEAWTHNKTIQKARESYRLSQEQKDYLETFKKVL